jgi:hypothetical protein
MAMTSALEWSRSAVRRRHKRTGHLEIPAAPTILTRQPLIRVVLVPVALSVHVVREMVDANGVPLLLKQRAKLLESPPRCTWIISVARLGSAAQELVNLRDLQGGYAELARIPHGHPTMSKATVEATRAANGWFVHG